jgi:hypothetical protein
MKHLSRAYAYVSAVVFLLIASMGAQAAGTADTTITAIADNGDATFDAVKTIAIVIFGALIGVGIFRKVWGKFVSRT